MCHWCAPKPKPATTEEQLNARLDEVADAIKSMRKPAPVAETVKLETSRYRLDAVVSDDYMLLTLWDRRLGRLVLNLGLEGEVE